MNILWHRNDLRVHDNPAVAETGSETAPVYIFDPDWLESELVNDARIRFVIEALKDLNRQYVDRGTHLAVLYGDPLEVLEKLSLDHDVFFTADPDTLRQKLESEARDRYRAVKPGFLRTAGRGDPESWEEDTEEWIEADPIEPPESFSQNPVSGSVMLDEIEDKHDLDAEKNGLGTGGRTEGEKRLESFLGRMHRYMDSISSPSKAERNTSHLSPYIRYGCLSVREVYEKVKENGPESFLDRLFWNLHFTQKIEDNPDLLNEAINPVYRDLYRGDGEPELVKAWKSGETGFPLVDASMRALVETGWMNFRMRAMCVSFYSYILKQWWKEGADFFHRHLIDSDPAINYYQWQMQSGLIGVHANRIYDPTKQAEENDPEGRYIRKYVPELRNVPDKFIHEPWKMPERVQQAIGVEIGLDYPEPVLDYEREAEKARSFFERKAPEAYAAFRDDETWGKASLGSSHDRDKILERAGSAQSDLSGF